MAEIAPKDRYADLTDKQQRVVDEYVKDPTAQNKQIAERAETSRTTVYNVKEHYGDILERRLRDPAATTADGGRPPLAVEFDAAAVDAALESDAPAPIREAVMKALKSRAFSR